MRNIIAMMATPLALGLCLQTATADVPTRKEPAHSAANHDLDAARDLHSKHPAGELAAAKPASQDANDSFKMRSIDANARTPLHLAAQSDRTLDALHELLQSSQSGLESRDVFGMTPLALAAFYGNTNAIRSLANAGARLDTRNDDASTPMHLAAQGAHTETLAWLIAHGASLDACDRWERRPLDIVLLSDPFAYADMSEKLRLATLLGGTEQDVARGAFYRHPLHVAIAKLDLDAVSRELESGVSADIRNEHGETALRIAIDDYNGPTPMVSRQRRAFARRLLPLLIKHGADADLRMPRTMITYREYAHDRDMGKTLDRLIQRRGGDPVRHATHPACRDAPE